MFHNIVIFLFTCSILIFSYDEGKFIIARVFGLIILAMYVVQLVQGREKSKSQVFFFPIFLWLIWSLLGALANGANIESLFRILTLCQLVVVGLAISSFLERRNTDWLWYGFVVSAIVISGLVFRNPQAYATADGRVFGTMSNSNMFGGALILSLMVIVKKLYEVKSKLLMLLLFAAFGLIFYMLLKTGSRKGMICGLLFPGGLFLYMGFVDQRISVLKKLVIAMVAVVGMVSAAVAITQSEHFRRIERVVNAIESGDESEAGESERGRFRFYEIGIEQTLNHPILGVGIGNFANIVVNGQKLGTYSHSNYIEVMTTTGLIGLFLFYSFHVRLLKSLGASLKVRRALGKGVGATSFAISVILLQMVYDFAMVSFYEKIVWLVLSGVIAELTIGLRDCDVERKRYGT